MKTLYIFNFSFFLFHCIVCALVIVCDILLLFLNNIFVCSCLGVKGVKRFEARHLVVDALIEKKLFRGTKSYAMTLPVCR